MKREKQKRTRIIIFLTSILLLMTVGYAAYNTNLNITGTSNISNSWDIEITNISDPTLTGSAKHVAKEIGTNKLSASMEADLYDEGDSAEYTVTIQNKGSVDAALDSISKDISDSNENIDISFSGYTKGQRLSAGNTMTVNVTIAYPTSTAYNTDNINSNIRFMSNTLATGEVRITFNFVQAEGYEGSEDFPIPTTYLLTYDYNTNGGTSTDAEDEYLNSGTEVTLNKQAYKNGYTFVGWNTDSSATTGLNKITLNSNTTLYAIYKKEFTITYTKGDNVTSIGKETDTCTAYNNNTTCTVTLPSITPTSDIYQVLGWYKDNTKVGDPNDTYTLTSNEILISKVKQNKFTLTYNYNGATGNNTQASKQVTYNSTYGDLPEPTKTGYTFKGWYKESTFENVVTSETIYDSTENTNIYAKWEDETAPTVSLSPNEQNDYTKDGTAVTVTLEDNGSGLAASQKVYYAWSTSNSSVPSYTNYVTSTNTAGAKSTTVIIPATASSSLTGTYYLWIKVGTVSDVSGNTSLVKTSNAFKFDNSDPTLSLSTVVTTSTITVTATASAQSDIKTYAFTIDGSAATCKSGTASNICIIENLGHNTAHTLGATVTSNVNKTKSTSTTATTTKINTPTFTDTDITNGIKVTITYPDGCTSYTCEYSTNSGSSWTTVTTSTKELSYTTAGTYNIIARVTDKTYSSNIVTTSTHTIKIEALSQATISKLNASVVTSGDGLYKDSTETDRYIYKGTNPNNYIQFNGGTWRIYSIESDGSIKIIRDALYNTSVQFDAANVRPSNSYCNYNGYGCNAWAKTSSFVNGSATGVVTEDSQMLTYLNSGTFWASGLKDTAKGQIVAHEWNVGPAGTNSDTYSYSQLVSSTYEGKYKWTGNIALLTKSEYMRANSSTSSNCITASGLSSNYSSCRSTNWLYSTIIANNWWLLSPTSGNSTTVFTAYYGGNLSSSTATTTSIGVRPALYLKANLNFTGSGTNDSNIYKISD